MLAGSRCVLVYVLLLVSASGCAILKSEWPGDPNGPGHPATAPAGTAGHLATTAAHDADDEVARTAGEDASPGTATTAADGTTAGTGTDGGAAGDESAGDPRATSGTVSGNPAAANIVTGNGRLGEALGMRDTGIRLGGINIDDANGNLAGGLGPGKWAGDSLTIVDLLFDLEKMLGWKDALVGTEFLYFTGFGPGYTIDGVHQGKDSTTDLAGSVMGVNSLDNAPPHSRAELYQLWFRQVFFNDKLAVRIGKSVPTYDFDNVVRPIPLRNPQVFIPAITSALITPAYINPTMLGVMPGYYNSATGVVAAYLPAENIHLQYGFFDGNLANRRQTGQEGPHFNGYWLHLLQAGQTWTIGKDELPGKFGVGGWFQTGKLTTFSNTTVNGASGMYLFGSQRLFFTNPKVNSNGLESYLQYGATNTDIVSTHRFLGAGLTYFGPLPGRDKDSVGFALGYGRMTGNPDAANHFFTLPEGTSLKSGRLAPYETLLTWYYQYQVRDNVLVQPNLTYVVDPGRHEGIPDALVLTLRYIMLF
jgi:porin